MLLLQQIIIELIHNPIHEDMLTNPKHKLELLDVVDEDAYYNKKEMYQKQVLYVIFTIK